MRRHQPSAPIAQITRINSEPAGGYTVTIGYGPGNAPITALAEIDALSLAEQSERDWRDLLTQHGIGIPS
jgi:metal-dependent amidase/aminoacylase/carboxypeptidase family protein